VVKFRERDEKFLPEESVDNLHDHSNEFFNDCVSLSSCEFDVFDSNLELWEILLNNEISIFCRDDEISKLGNHKLSNEPWQNNGEDRREESCKSDEIDMGKVSFVKNLSPVLDWLVTEHCHEIL